ncbi:hypothetical protein ANT_22110 [Anaerolinea thermophila UNI-1]|uniref:Uncharacterized protein n=1 Tax=Anaerolinea thermophila (strain DSM 14523 / JCM 11388 / NBRC 100420 / UNI-1) TaxID=926569 RepID=E8MY06_ANATU|nr:hypothetical protein ANT_22110 [Anaerolinea thermophila UNI-1]
MFAEGLNEFNTFLFPRGVEFVFSTPFILIVDMYIQFDDKLPLLSGNLSHDIYRSFEV